MPCDEDMDNIVASSQSSEELNVGSSAAPIVNPKSMVESIKAHLIGTSKLLNQLETAAEQCEAGNLKLSKLAKELAPHTAENIKLREQLAKETSAIMDLEGKLVRLTGSDDTTSTYDSLQSDLTTAIEDTDHVDSRIRSCDIYIKQLEAQVMNLDEQLKGPIPEPKKTKRTIRSFEIKENQIKELQQNINKAINAKESAENDKMEINITCKMLQKDYDVLKETMMKQQQQHDVALAVLEKQYQTLLGEIQQQETLLNTSTNISTTNALNDMHRQLRDNHIYIKQLQDQVERSKQSAHPVQSDLITDFRQCLAEHEKLKMEKRVLQDRLTEEWMIDEDYKISRRKILLTQHGLLKSKPEEIYGSDQSTMIPPERLSNIQQQSSLPSPTTTTTTTTSIHGTNQSEIRTPASRSTMTLTPPSFQQRQSPRSKPQPDQQDQYSDSSDSPAPIKRKRKRVIISDSSESPSPPPSQHSLSSTDSDTGSTFVPSLSEMTFGKHKATLVKPSTSVQKVVETPFLSLLESIKKPMKDPDTPPNGSINESIITSRVKDLIFGTPLHNQYLLNDMEDYTGPYLGVFLSCIETKLSKIRSPGAPVNLLAKDFDGNIRTWTFGVDGMISIHGCPQYIQFMEKNLTWALWALVHLYPKNNLYPTLMKWAANKVLVFGKKERGNIACRFLRLLLLLCKNANDKQRASVFCYDLMITLPKSVNIMTYIINIALIWPELLNLDIKRSDIGTDMIIKTIHRCCAHYCISNMNEPTQIAKTLYDYMVILVHWPELQYDQQLNHHAIHLTAILKSPVFKSLYHTNRYVFNDTRINLVKSLELCFTRLDHWDTTYSEFIIPHIMPLMKDKTLANVCLEILGTLGAGALHSHQNKEKPGVNVIRQIFKGVLNFGNNCSEEDFPLQCVAAKGLILLSKENFPSVTPVLHWYSLIQPSFKKLVPPGLAYGIQQLGSHLK